VQTRKTLAMSAIGMEQTAQADRLLEATTEFFDQAGLVAAEYSDPS
jgi:hypothetical protein